MNSMLDSGEAGIGGITVTLKDGNGNTLATTTTAANALTPSPSRGRNLYRRGSRNCRWLQPGNDKSALGCCHGRTEHSQQQLRLRHSSARCLSGTLYVDANKNSMLDSGEAGIGGITVTLKNSNGTVIATTTTASNGTYSSPISQQNLYRCGSCDG